ncbi:hypothetical protein [Shinella zoogloeoides]|nr:hypothetical protein [Shinella zoogloeoides]UEX82787.1 hypothetical protein K8M09_05775 [Shinella zoogloeoides]
MTAMSEGRQLVEIAPDYSDPPVKGGVTIHQGALVVMEGGLAVPGKTATNLTAVGFALKTVKNTGADGSVTVPCKRGTFRLFNQGADAVTAGDISKDCFVVDDQTVAKTNGTNTRSVAGKVIAIDAAGVFVRVGY